MMNVSIDTVYLIRHDIEENVDRRDASNYEERNRDRVLLRTRRTYFPTFKYLLRTFGTLFPLNQTFNLIVQFESNNTFDPSLLRQEDLSLLFRRTLIGSS